ncbi:MAG: hypothetical protein QMC81_10560 [Thermoanaerobacterales bacterium]|nr:hypothetical protein [Thermoanaerobacterales bacterium]
MNSSDPVKPIEIYLFEPDPKNPGYVRHIGNRPVGEVFSELKERLKAENLLPEESFHIVYLDSFIRPKYEAEFPRYRWLACYAVTGTSEGHYIRVDALVLRPDLDPPICQAEPVFLGKTFKGLDFAQAVAAACARHLGA